MHVQRLIAMFVLVTQLTGCTSWHVQEISPRQLLAEQQPGQIRVERTDCAWLYLWEPWLADTVSMGEQVRSPGASHCLRCSGWKSSSSTGGSLWYC